MKYVLAAMLLMFAAIVWPFGGLFSMLLSSLLGGGGAESYIYPLYVGLILLAGIVVGCTVVIVHEIRENANKHTKSVHEDTKA